MYAIIDVETTGYGAAGRITDIAIFIHDGERVVEEFQTFVNPETYIPENITRLTRITNEMVAQAPKFYEVAKKIFEITEGKIFVAHNVNFDYGIIRNEFKQLGGVFERETLCTIKLARRLMPGFKSYSLGKLCDQLNIPHNDRHRAYGDTKATAQLFAMLKAKSEDIGEVSLKPVSAKKQLNLPPLLDKSVYESLPETYGVYYFYNATGEVIYVGKANNIKQRVASHFNDKKRKEQLMFDQTANITVECCGNELVALLLESAEIKRLFPLYNRSQKKLIETHGLFHYQDREGITCLAVGSTKNAPKPLVSFYNIRQAKNFLESMVQEHALCPKYCGLEKATKGCFASSINNCHGVCCGREQIDEYNKRVENALADLSLPTQNFYILEAGRKPGELAVISVQNGIYQGFGFVEDTSKSTATSKLSECVKPYPDNSDSQRILKAYLKNGPTDKVVWERNEETTFDQ